MCVRGIYRERSRQANKQRDIARRDHRPAIRGNYFKQLLPDYYGNFEARRAEGDRDRTARKERTTDGDGARICRGKVEQRRRTDGPQLGRQRRHVSFVRESYYRARRTLSPVLSSSPVQDGAQSQSLELDHRRRLKSVNWKFNPMIVRKMDNKNWTLSYNIKRTI